ncbi:hypothetical protein PUN28_018095 [Cardiocondyla obscurior]|uniref:RNB domain-containing protein n=1 Tax=Cardiocondyla obscurior TaxID=286306 RepID=A0AAW2EIH4_9HYME
MSIYLASNKRTRTVEYRSRRKNHSNTCRNKRNSQKTNLNFLNDKAFTSCYDELTELSAQFSANLTISSSLQSKRSVKFNENIAGNIEEQIVQCNTTRLANTSQVFYTRQYDAKNTKHNTAKKCKNFEKKKTQKNNKIKRESVNDKCMIKNVKTQISTSGNKSELLKSKKITRNMTELSMTAEAKSSTKKENYNKKFGKKGANKNKINIFSNYISVSYITRILKKQSSCNVQYVKGNLRINPFCFKYAYLSINNEDRDLLIFGIPNRNRAFEGDLVVASINPKEEWYKCSDGFIQKTGKIVCILEKVHHRRAVGHLKKQDSLFMFHPRDQKVPFVVIHSESIPPLYHDQPNLYKNTLFFINIDSWEQHNIYPSGRVLLVVGKSGEINTELKAIILENNLDMSPYQEKLLKELPDSEYILTEADMKNREDWRHECIFTIDPETAVDIDDALSCKILDNGNYEIGVHISDVTHYLKFFSPLDMEVLKRANTVYLPHMTSHMLPERLCKVCSLLPGKDRLAFSVIWELTANAEIVKYRFAKTVIRSCCQMSYNLAQAMLDDPKKSWPENFLDVKGDYSTSLLSDIVNELFNISNQLKSKRFKNGALKLDLPKLQIRIDPILSQERGFPIPVNYSIYERTESNSLVEELMLLANVTVATHLYTTIPTTALLRVHKTPSKQSLNTLQEMMQKYGIHLNIESSGSLQSSIHRYENIATKYIMMVIINLCLKSMTRAEYTCASTNLSYDLKHYALNVPFYTHFTSPIRRYSDCIVHRLLSSTLENKPLPEKWTAKLCSKIAANCNVKKYSAKLAQDQSTEVFFAYMVGLAGGFKATGTVLYVKEDGIDVILCDTGIKLKVNLKDTESIVLSRYSTDFVPTITITWQMTSIAQVISLFSLVHIQVTKVSEELRLKGTLLPPLEK